jgi:hypothetical protein
MGEVLALHRWFEMAKDDAIVIDPTDINNEAMENLWCFSPYEEELPGITAEGVAEFVRRMVEARGKQLQGEAMLFYCWHDFQTRQLRFSLVSKSHGRLPFGCALKETEDPSVIADLAVDGDWCNASHGQASPGDVHEEVPFVLPVFVANIP